MTDSQSKTTAIVLSTISAIFMISIGFGFLPWNIAVFAGVVCFVLAAMMRRLAK
jgi:hypothetical protein